VVLGLPDVPATVTRPGLSCPVMLSLIGGRWPGCLFLLVTVVALVPIWSVGHLPTVDGPAHLYNAWIVGQLAGSRPLFGATFEVSLAPVPNWFSTVALLLLLRVLPAVAAERALVSLYAVLFSFGLWFAAGAVCRERRWLAFLGLPFAYSLFLEMGFYNFCFSVALYLLAVGIWWQRRASPGVSTAVALNGVLLLCYFCHIVSLVLALLSIALLWCCTLRRRNWHRHWLHVPMLAPQLALPAWFLLRGDWRAQPSDLDLHSRLAGLARLDCVAPFQQSRGWLGGAVVTAFVLVFARSFAVRLRERDAATGRVMVREEDAFLLLSLVLAIVYLFAPEGFAGGSNLVQRLALFPFLALIPWLSPRLTARPQAAVIGLLAVLPLLSLGVAWSCYRVLDRQIAAYLHTLDRVAVGSHVLPLTWDHEGGCARAGIFTHMLDYAAIEKGFVDWNNYQAMTDLFPIRFKPGVRYPDNYLMEWEPDRLPIEQYRRSTEYVLTWRMPVAGPAHRRILLSYDEIATNGALRLFSRHPDGS
jgi:hypothetical protein